MHRDENIAERSRIENIFFIITYVLVKKKE
jgi:hypothetical protein